MKPKLLSLLLVASALTAACSDDDDNTGPSGGEARVRVVHASPDYTVIASGLAAAIEPIVLEDDNTAPPAGNVRVRAIHGAPSAPAVDIYVTALGADLAAEVPVLADVQFGDVSNYIEARAGDYQVRVTPAGTKTVVIDSGALTLAGGQVRTAIAVDAAGGGAPFDLLVLQDLN